MSAVSTIGELNEAQVHIQSLIGRLRASPIQEDEDFALSIDFGHILEHLNRAWHYRRMSEQEVDRLLQENFEECGKSIPNFGFEMRLLSGLDFSQS